MKTAPAFDAVVGKSHAVNTRIELRAPDDSLVGVLPMEAGTVSANGRADLAVWSGNLTLAGLDWAPDGPQHPLSGLSGHYCSIQRAAQPYGDAETWVEVARLWVYETTVFMSRRDSSLNVTLTSPAALLERAVRDSYASQLTGDTQQAIGNVLTLNLPYTPTVLDTTVSEPIPTDFDPKNTTPVSVAQELASAANIRVFFDALGRIIMRPTLPSLDVATMAPVRELAVDIDIVDYELLFGRDLFANDAVATYDWTDSQGNSQSVTGRAVLGGGPLGVDGVAGRLTLQRSYGISTSQRLADAQAAALLVAGSQAWVGSRMSAVQDPRIEPFDIVETRYLDRTLRHRVTAVQFDLTTDQMTLTGRTAIPTGGT